LRKLRTDEIPSISIVVPTLNEEENIRMFLNSIRNQPFANFETLVIDGGSKDATSGIAEEHDAKVVVLPGHGEFTSRNVGAKLAKGSFLLFTCADIVFPQNVLQRITEKFEENPELIALTGPGYPFDAPLVGKLEYAIYDLVRYFLAKLPKPLKRFSTSTNFLVVRKDYFEKTGGFLTDDINADGLMGRALLGLGKVAFCLDTGIYLSARRMKKMGLVGFNKHYLYVFENIFFFFSNIGITKAWKTSSQMKHRMMHEA